MTIDNSGKAARKLPYPLEYPDFFDETLEASGAVSAITTSFFPSDIDEKIDVVFNLSAREFTAFASAIDIGRDIGYGEQSALVWWTWIRSLIGIGGTAVTCEEIADCIDTSEEVQNAITTNPQILLQNLMANANSGIGDIPAIDAATSTTMNTPQGIGTAKDDDIKDLENCDLNMLWAGIRDGIVQRLDDNARSALEWLVSKADVGERATALVGAIPVFGAMAQAVLDQMVELAPDMLNLYEAYSSIAVMDEIACEIFGLVCSQCRYPTYQEVFSYYAAAGITGIDDLDDILIAAATDFLFASTELAALAFYHTMIAYELIVLGLGSKFYGLSGSSALVTLATLGEDFANDNWQTLCEDCDEPYAVWSWNFETQGQGESYVDSAISSVTNKPVFVAGKGWLLPLWSTGRRADIAMPLDPTWEMRAVAFNTSGAVLTARQIALRPTLGLTTGQSILSIAGGTGDYNHVANGLLSTTGMNEVAFFGQTGTTPAYINRIAIVFNKSASKSPSIPTSDPTL